MATIPARIFTDIHHSGSRPPLEAPDIYIDDVNGDLNTALSSIAGWDATAKDDIRAGWNLRSGNTLYPNPLRTDYPTSPQTFSAGGFFGNTIFGVNVISGAFNDYVHLSLDFGQTWFDELLINDAFVGYILPITQTKALAFHDDGDVNEIFWDGNSIQQTIISNTGIVGRHDYAVRLDNSNILVGTNGGGVLISTDDGLTWSNTSSDLSLGRIFYLNFLDNSKGYCSGTGGTLSKTIDGGLNWVDISPSNNDIYEFYVNNSGTIIIFPREENLIYKSTDDGATWTSVITDLDIVRNVLVISDELFYMIELVNNGQHIYDLNSDEIYSLFDTIENRWSTAPYKLGDVYYFILQATNKPINLDFSDYGMGLGVGSDKTKRLSYFFLNYDDVGDSYTPNTVDPTQQSFGGIVVDMLLKQPVEGTNSYIKHFLFTDSNGKPTSINYDAGAGAKDYIGWGIKYTNNNTTGNIDVEELVLLEKITYPATPDDTNTITADTLLNLTTVSVATGQFSSVRILKYSSLVQNSVILSSNEQPQYNGEVTNEYTVFNQAVTDTIFSHNFIEGGIHGLGGSGSVEGTGLVDNIRFLTA